MKTRVFLLALALSGCKMGQIDGDVVIHSGSYPHPDQSTVNEWYETVQDHIKNHDYVWQYVAPPEVWITDDTRKFCGNGAQAVVCPDGRIAIHYGYARYEHIWKHEFIHFIRHKNGTQKTGAECHTPQVIWDIQWPSDLPNKPAFNPADC